jgi:type IV secretory pathway VirB4 component
LSVPAHQVTTRHLGAVYPFASEPGLGGRGVLIGRDLFGGAFAYDPFELYRSGTVTNPNMVVFGQIGRGKSAFVKSYLWRQAAFGRRAWVVDPKGEYGPLAQAWGSVPIAMRPGGDLRLNPLEGPGDAPSEERARRRTELLASLATASLGRPLLPSERNALDMAVVAATAAVPSTSTPTLPDIVEALLAPDEAAARQLRSDPTQIAADGRQVALELRRLVSGDLRGMFDGPTTPGLALDGPLVVLDLSALYRSAALGVLMTCATAWLQARLAGYAQQDGVASGSFVVIDEAWAILSNLGVARWLQSSWKLARAYGVANIAVLHRLSDLQAVGGAGSEQIRVAEGLLADSETRVLYAQSPGEMDEARRLLGLSTTEAEIVPTLPRAVALWKVGTRSFLVEHHLAPGEESFVDTDVRMRSD